MPLLFHQHTTKEKDVSVVNASFHVTHWSVAPFGTGLSRVKHVGKLNRSRKYSWKSKWLENKRMSDVFPLFFVFFSSGFLFGGEVLRFFHGGDECLTIPSSWSEQVGQK